MGAEIEHAIKAAVLWRTGAGNVFRRGLFQERMRGIAGRRPCPPAGMELAVEDPHGIGWGSGGWASSPDYVAARRAKDKAQRRRRPSGGLASLIWPRRSLIYQPRSAGPRALEPELWAKLHFLSDPLCARCGTPFEIAVDVAQECGACLRSSAGL